MAKKQTKPKAKSPARAPRRRGGGVGSYILTMVISAVVTAILIAVLVVVTAPMRNRGGVTVASANNATEAVDAPSPTPQATSTPARTGVIASASNQAVNVRSGAGTSFDVVGTVDSGTTVIILGQNADGLWQNIQLEDGTQGWVSTSLMRLPQEPTATPVVEAAQTAEATEVLVVECQGTEAADWWMSSGSDLYTQAKLAVIRAAANQLNNINDLYISVETDLATFEQAEYPPCVEVLRERLIEGSQEVMAGLQDYANGDLGGGRNRVANAQTGLFDPVLQTLSTDLDVIVFSGDCPVDAWFAGIEPSYARFIEITREFAPGTTAQDQVRTMINEQRRLRQSVADAFAPDCAATVSNFLLDTMDAFLAMLQGSFAGDQAALQSNQSVFVSSRDAFQAEMRRLGYPV